MDLKYSLQRFLKSSSQYLVSDYTKICWSSCLFEIFILKKSVHFSHVYNQYIVCTTTHSVSLGTDLLLEQTTTQQFFLSPKALKIVISSPRQTKTPDNSNTLNMFDSNTYTKFQSSLHTLLLWWCHAEELFESQIPVTTGGFELQIVCIQSSYLIH